MGRGTGALSSTTFQSKRSEHECKLHGMILTSLSYPLSSSWRLVLLLLASAEGVVEAGLAKEIPKTQSTGVGLEVGLWVSDQV